MSHYIQEGIKSRLNSGAASEHFVIPSAVEKQNADIKM
jgi:hypothetical protein